MHAVLTRVDVFSCHVSCCVVGKIRREEHILVRNFYTVRVETHTGREMMVDGRLSYGGIFIYSLKLRKNRRWYQAVVSYMFYVIVLQSAW